MNSAKGEPNDHGEMASRDETAADRVDSIRAESGVKSPIDFPIEQLDVAPVQASASAQAASSRVAWALHPTHRRGLAILLLLGCAIAGGRLIRDRSDIPLPAREGMFAHELQDRIDPNEADAELLSALPGLGARRAGDIVRFRERMKPITPDGVVFKSSHDLMQVRGIGAALSAQLEPFLHFPTSSQKSQTSDSPNPERPNPMTDEPIEAR